jgi:hypothetical protein
MQKPRGDIYQCEHCGQEVELKLHNFMGDYVWEIDWHYGTSEENSYMGTCNGSMTMDYVVHDASQVHHPLADGRLAEVAWP